MSTALVSSNLISRNRLSTLFKIVFAGGIFLLSSAFTNPAHASGYYGGGYHGGGRHYSGFRDSHYNRHYNRGYRHRRHRSNDRGAYLIGGLAIGAIVTHAIHNSANRRVERDRVYRNDHQNTRRISRRLFRDRDGNCFERTHNQQGDELLIELDRAECAW